MSQKAPVVKKPSRDKPFNLSFKDKPTPTKGKSPMSPLSKKRLSK